MKEGVAKKFQLLLCRLVSRRGVDRQTREKSADYTWEIDGPRDNARHRHLARPLLDQRQNGLSCAGQWQTCLSEKAPLLYIQVITP
jgi:hypothetical protein